MRRRDEASAALERGGGEAMPKKEIVVSCPFCGEDDFDLIGLKSHLRDCDAYQEIETLGRIFHEAS